MAMKKRIIAALPDFRDLHIYAGLVVVGVAGSAGAWGWVAVGVALFYLGVFRMKGA